MYMNASVAVPGAIAAGGAGSFLSLVPPRPAYILLDTVRATQQRQHARLVKRRSERRPRRSTHKAPMTAIAKELQLMPRLTFNCWVWSLIPAVSRTAP
jgi:hypothetical protein